MLHSQDDIARSFSRRGAQLGHESHLTCADTVEDRLQPLLDRKERTFDLLIDALQHRPDAVRELLVP